MKIIVSGLHENEREQWEKLYYGYADFYSSPMDAAVLDTIWSWIFDKYNPFFGLIAKNEAGDALQRKGADLLFCTFPKINLSPFCCQQTRIQQQLILCQGRLLSAFCRN